MSLADRYQKVLKKRKGMDLAQVAESILTLFEKQFENDEFVWFIYVKEKETSCPIGVSWKQKVIVSTGNFEWLQVPEGKEFFWSNNHCVKELKESKIAEELEAISEKLKFASEEDKKAIVGLLEEYCVIFNFEDGVVMILKE